jgi:hypothetical protein
MSLMFLFMRLMSGYLRWFVFVPPCTGQEFLQLCKTNPYSLRHIAPWTSDAQLVSCAGICECDSSLIRFRGSMKTNRSDGIKGSPFNFSAGANRRRRFQRGSASLERKRGWIFSTQPSISKVAHKKAFPPQDTEIVKRLFDIFYLLKANSSRSHLTSINSFDRAFKFVFSNEL